jgi:lysylphosphatidylglycerol synthetase-like protein (DUF2156 family)
MKGTNQYMKNLSKKLTALLIVPAIVLGVGLTTVTVGAQGAQIKDGLKSANSGKEVKGGVKVKSTVGSIVNWLLFAIGAIAVIMIVWGGIKYATSAGDSNKVTAAKNTILYAVIGLAVAVLAFFVVNFVVDLFTTTGNETTLKGPDEVKK